MFTNQSRKIFIRIRFRIHYVSERNPGDTLTIEGRIYNLNCNGEVGDMLYLTDLDYTSTVGHNIAEVEIYGTGRNYFHLKRAESKEPMLFDK